MVVESKLADIETKAKKRADDIIRIAQRFGGLPRSALEMAAVELNKEGVLGPVIAELLSRGEGSVGAALIEFAVGIEPTS